MKERANTSKQTPDSGDTKYTMFCHQVPIEERAFMPVSPAQTKKTNSQTKSENCKNTTATTNTTDGRLTLPQSENTSQGASTSSPKHCTPYWTPDCLELSQKLLSLTATPHAGGDLNISMTWPSNTTLDAWFSTHLHFPPKFPSYNTLLESLTSFPPEFSNTDATLVRTKKLRIYPQKQTTRHWNRYTGLARFWFNQALQYLKQPNTKAILKEVRHLQKRPYAAWAFDCPQRIREHALADAVKAVKNAKAKCHQTGTFQEVSWRAKKHPTQGFGLDAQSLQQTSMFSQLSHRLYFHTGEGIPNESLEGVRIVRENGRWFAIVPQPRQVVKPESQRQPIVALDPGVRTFLSLYGIGFYGDFGRGDFGRIRRLCHHLDDLMGRKSKRSGRKKRSLNRAAQRLRWRIRDLVDELHKKVAHFLVTRFEVILLPTFETQQMVSKLNSKTARAMMTWAHYRFKQHLKAKAEEYSAVVVEVNEAYTSKTCSYCGSIQHIGSKKRFRCRCGADVDRDHQGARGIFLRALSVTTADPSALCLASVQHLLTKR